MAGLLDIQAFSKQFFSLTNGWTWEVEGFLDKKDNVHPIDSDTKVISTVFERFASPVLRSIAKRHTYVVELSNQTTYPDFTLTQASSKHRIAIDIKTTYESPQMVFTLGGYSSFLRNNTKNILYPYDSYTEHWIIGFIYAQQSPYPAYDLETMPKRSQIWCPYQVKSVFVRKKHEICGLRAGSGNTKNIGSVRLTNAFEFATHQGPFTRFARGKEACDQYWRKYESYSAVISSTAELLRHSDFQQFV